MNKALLNIYTDENFLFCLNFDRSRINHLFRNTSYDPVLISDDTDLTILTMTAGVKALVVFVDSKGMIDVIQSILEKKRDVKVVGVVKDSMFENPGFASYLDTYFYSYLVYPFEKPILISMIKQIEKISSILCPSIGSKNCSPVERIINHNEDGDCSILIGNSGVMQSAKNDIRRFAQVDAPLIISGESGTGKELAAQLVHNLSSRSENSFIAVNIAALPEELIFSELFGHEKGAFTGAEKRSIGYVEKANFGTLFLDEIGDMPLRHQVGLLRFLQEGVITRVGGVGGIKINARIIAASHINLKQAVKAGKFREDLYYRLNVLNLHMPSLRDRDFDIDLLSNHFLKLYCKKLNKPKLVFDASANSAIRSHRWPGNIRELMNRVHCAVVMADGDTVSSRELKLQPTVSSNKPETLSDAKDGLERRMLSDALNDTNFNISACSKILGISRVTLYKLMKKHKISKVCTNTNSGNINR